MRLYLCCHPRKMFEFVSRIRETVRASHELQVQQAILDRRLR